MHKSAIWDPFLLLLPLVWLYIVRLLLKGKIRTLLLDGRTSGVAA